MNEQLRPPSLPVTTQAAEGLPRRRWSVAEIEDMVAKGTLGEDERFELIGGEVVPMSPKGNRHELLKKALQQYWFPRIVGSPIDLITETTLIMGKDEFVEPDFLFWPRATALKEVTAETALLIVELADTSLAYDIGRKADLYAAAGLREYWVINAETLVTRVQRDPSPTGYRVTSEFGPYEHLVPRLVPALAVTLGKLDLH